MGKVFLFRKNRTHQTDKNILFILYIHVNSPG